MLEGIKSSIRQKLKTVLTPREDYRVYEHGGMWGRNISISKVIKYEDDFVKGFKVMGHWTPKPREGDVLLWRMVSERRSVSVFTDVHYYRDPHDMFRGTVEMIGYEEHVFLPNGEVNKAYIEAYRNARGA